MKLIKAFVVGCLLFDTNECMDSGYLPKVVECPKRELVRKASELSPEEKQYIAGRNLNSQRSLEELIGNVSIGGYDRNILKQPINIALSFSGGGYRSMLTAAGVLAAFDKRTPGDTNSSLFRGILQSANYIGGISGGSWLVMANAVNDFKPMVKLRDSEFNKINQRLLSGVPDFDPGFKGNIRNSTEVDEPKSSCSGFVGNLMCLLGIGMKHFDKNFKSPIISLLTAFNKGNNTSSGGPEEFDYGQVFEFYKNIHLEVSQKRAFGGYISFTDYWGRALNNILFLSYETHTFSSVVELPSFQSYQQPFPIICSIQKTPEMTETSENSHLMEFSPYEFGSWDDYLGAFLELKYVGTEINSGDPVSSNCTAGFDNVGFIVATSSSLFNSVFMRVYNYLIDVPEETKTAIQTILLIFGLTPAYKASGFRKQHPDFAIFAPNPFYNYSEAVDSIKTNHELYLVDGGEDGENIPFQPFLQPSRAIDVILSFDMSSDIFNFPNGSSLVKSSKRYQNPNPSFGLPSFNIGNHIFSRYPKVPTIEQTQRSDKEPIFLGCDPYYDYPSISVRSNITSSIFPPLIVYTPNREISYPSNTSTFKLSYTKEEINGMLQNGADLATLKNSTDFAACLTCAILKRSFDRNNFQGPRNPNYSEIPEKCQQCYKKFCFHKIEQI